MPERIAIKLEGLTIRAQLDDSPCAQQICRALPVEARLSTWGQEIYFPIGVSMGLTGAARADMAVGEIAYWPPGKALCIFFGRTPASGPDGGPRAASEVEPVGRVLDDIEAFKGVTDGQKVVLSAEAQ